MRKLRLAWTPSLLLRWSCLALLATLCNATRPPVQAARRPARQLQQQSSPPFSTGSWRDNVVQREPTTLYQEWQGADNVTLACLIVDSEVRLTGPRLAPFSLEDQYTVVQAFRNTILPTAGFVELTSFREFFPDEAAPPALQEPFPGVDFGFTFYYVLNESMVENWETLSWDMLRKPAYAALYAFQAEIQRQWASSITGRVVYAHYGLGNYTEGDFVLHPVLVLNATLALELTSGGPAVSAQQASAVAQVVTNAVWASGAGTLVEVVGRTGLGGFSPMDPSRPEVLLQVTLYLCRDGATLPTPQCEQEILTGLISEALAAGTATSTATGNGTGNGTAPQLLGAAGVRGAALAAAGPRPAPQPPLAAEVAAAPQPWVPWNLDRLDQRGLPLDGKFAVAGAGAGEIPALGTGVNVYIISSGVRGDHEEFGFGDGAPGSRIRAAWGYLGLDPLQDCPDFATLSGFGTFAASTCCGLKLGPAKNATVYSVRFRGTCTDDPVYWGDGALPAAIDLVLSTYVEPAIVLIDTWWSAARVTKDAKAITDAITLRLDRFTDTNITVIAPAGPGCELASACTNVISSHKNVISVASTDVYDQVTAYDPTNAGNCIDLFAPGGGLGHGTYGASAAGPHNYTQMIARSSTAAQLAAGVAAQYLQYHPAASRAQVLQALTSLATGGEVAGVGSSPNLLLFTNLSQPAPPGWSGGSTGTGNGSGGGGGTEPAGGSGGGGGGLSTGAVAAIAVVAALAVIGAVAAGIVWRRRRGRGRRSSPGTGKDASGLLNGSGGWEVSPGDIEVCRRPDGSEWVLGEGRYGRVYKALKGGVQVVAVKKLIQVDEQFKALLVKEIDMMKYVSRDANVTQFYGACIQGDDMMLVAEYMEGGDLREALSGSGGGRLQWYARGKEVVLDVVRGAHFLHSNQVVHRDIKSKNVLLGRDGRAKLSDVGLAQLFEGRARGRPKEKSKDRGLSQDAAWTAPEVLAGGAATDKADVYSLGVVLWEVVTMEAPPPPGAPPARRPEAPRECPAQVADAIAACLQRDPSQRPTARELYGRLLSCPPVTAPGVSPQLSSLGRVPLLLASGSDATGGGHSKPGSDSGGSHSKLARSASATGGGGKSLGGSSSGGASKDSGGGGGAANGKAGSKVGGGGKGGEGKSSDVREGRSGSKSSSRGGRSDGKSGSRHGSRRGSSAGGRTPLQLSPGLRRHLGGDVSLVTIDFEKIDFCRLPDGSKERLGGGAYGQVYRVLLDGVQPLAAKCVELGSDAKIHAAFMQEAELMWRLRHKNVVGLSGVCFLHDQGILLMELMEGGSLHRMLNASSKTTRQRVFSWGVRGKHIVLDIARGLHYLHSLRVTHFDLSSRNVLLTREFFAKVSDVGLARVMSRTHHSISVEEGGHGPPGTLAYMAPELLAGDKCTQSVDIYSFGVLLWEICTGIPPERGSMRDLAVPQDCPQAVADLYRRCTAEDPAVRPTAREVVEQLTAAAAAAPAAATPRP